MGLDRLNAGPRKGFVRHSRSVFELGKIAHLLARES